MPFGFKKFLHRLLEDVHTPHYFNEIALVGVAADKPSGANAKDNMLYYETDTGLWKRYRTALSSWVIVTSIAQIMGYDYTATLLRNIAVDPETKALLLKSQVTGGNGGVSDHGELTGLQDDDHNTVYFNQARGDARYLKLSGGTLTGLLTLSGAPTVNLHAATKKYVDEQAPGAFDNYKCRAYLGSNQTININTYTKINLSATSYDPHSCFDSANKRIVIKKAGDYLIIGRVWFDYNIGDGAVCVVEVKKNGSVLLDQNAMCADGTTKDIHPQAADVFPLAVNDYLDLWGGYNKGDAQATIQATPQANFLTVIRMP